MVSGICGIYAVFHLHSAHFAYNFALVQFAEQFPLRCCLLCSQILLTSHVRLMGLRLQAFTRKGHRVQNAYIEISIFAYESILEFSFDLSENCYLLAIARIKLNVLCTAQTGW